MAKRGKNHKSRKIDHKKSKKTSQKISHKTKHKKTRNTTRTKKVPIWPFIIGMIIVLILASLFWYSSPYQIEIDDGMPMAGADFLDVPIAVEPNEKFTIQWEVVGLDNVITSEVHYAVSPVGIVIDGTKKEDTLYNNVLSSSYVDGIYSVELTAPGDGGIFFQVYTTDGVNNYWSQTNFVVIQ
ncbi:hypothetical protein ACFLZN_00405 [Nanoarchaeota archaeon]